MRTLFILVLLPLMGLVSCDSKEKPAGSGSSSGPENEAVSRFADRSEILAIDLAEQSPGGSTLFEQVEGAAVGLDFVHRWELKKDTVELFDRVEAGGGVTVGDVNGDGLPDVYLTRPLGGARLYRNLGGFHFEDITAAAGLEDESYWSSGAAFADVDNDGDLDLAVCGFDCPTRLFINDGAGKFVDRASELGFRFTGSGIMVAFSDYDRDGDLDAFLATNRYSRHLPDPRYDDGKFVSTQMRQGPDGKPVFPPALDELWGTVDRPGQRPWIIRAGQRGRLFRNDGGRFVEAGKEAGLQDRGMTLSATWWDHNSDGWPDLYLANDFMGPDRLYENQRDGTFRDVAPEILPQVPWYSMGSDVGDINNDGRDDFIATDMAGSTHYKSKLAMGDMDKFAWFLESGAPRQYMRNAVYLNTGRGRKMEVGQQLGLHASDWTWSPKFGDFDCDGWLDIFITNGMTGDLFNSDSRRQSRLGVDTPLSEIEPKRDINMAFRNRGDLSFEDVGAKWGLAEANASFGAALADLDLDGDLDIIVNRFNEPAALYRNRASGERVRVKLFGRHSNSQGLGATVAVTANRLTQTRTLTSSRGVLSTNESVLIFGLGEAERIERLEVRWPSGHRQSFEDLAAGRAYEITEPAATPPGIDPPPPPAPSLYARVPGLSGVRHRELSFDDFESQPLLPNRMSRLGPGVAIGDVDGDGDEDAYLGGARGSLGSLLLREGSGWTPDTRNEVLFAKARLSEDMGSFFFDAEGDGDADLYVVSGGVEANKGSSFYRDRLYLNDGAGLFGLAAERSLPPSAESGSCVVAADYDRDGDLDLFVGGRVVPGEYPLAPPSRLLRNDSTKDHVSFADVTEEVAPALLETGMVTAALWTDVDGDGDSDLMVTHEWGAVKLYRNTDGKLDYAPASTGVANLLGWWNGIAGGDVDGDGDIDYAVSNFGLNTKYHPSPAKPVVLYYGDFSGDGVMRIVEAKMTADGFLPVRGFSCSSGAIKSVKDQVSYQTPFHDFAIKSLSSLYTEERLDKALRLEVNELRSGLLINDGTGSFTFRPLPALAQNSPGFGLSFCDADDDRHLDLYMVQNFFSPQPETGRMHGGLSLLMKGRGDGEFDSVWPEVSGLLVAGDAKALARLTGGEFLVSQNDGELIMFSPATRASQRCTVKLVGKAGNLQAVGARVFISEEGGAGRSFEVYGGSGYLGASTTEISVPIGEPQAGSKLKVSVKWPDGSQSEHDLPTSGTSAIQQP